MVNDFISSNHELHAYKGQRVLIVASILPLLSLIALSLRLFTRIKIIRNPALDDWFSAIAVLFSILSSICVILQVQNGMGRHIQTLTQEQAVKYFKSLYACILIYSIGHLFTKLSILLQYLRIATSRKIRSFCYIMILLNVTLGLEIFLTGVFHCWPVPRFWDKTMTGKCINTTVLWLFNTSMNIMGDLILLVLPMFILSASNLPRRRKILLWVILSSGSFAAIISVWRLYFLYFISISNDITWDNPGISIWACIELNTSIIASCLSTLKPLITRYFPIVFRTIFASSEGRHTSVVGMHGSEAQFDPSNIHNQKAEFEMLRGEEFLHDKNESSHKNGNNIIGPPSAYDKEGPPYL